MFLKIENSAPVWIRVLKASAPPQRFLFFKLKYADVPRRLEPSALTVVKFPSKPESNIHFLFFDSKISTLILINNLSRPSDLLL